jgi:hypothetical protein
MQPTTPQPGTEDTTEPSERPLGRPGRARLGRSYPKRAKRGLSGAALVIAVSAATGQAAPPPASADQLPAGPPPAQTFYYSGSYQKVTVPAGVNAAMVKVVGGHGGDADDVGGDGAQVSARVPVTSGQLLYVYVGGNGGSANVPHHDDPAGGWGFPGPGGTGGTGSGGPDGAGGGGASAIYQITPRAAGLVIAGGGGGGAGFGVAPGVDAGGAGGSSGTTVDDGHGGKGPGSGGGGAGAGSPSPKGGEGTAAAKNSLGGGGGGGGGGYLGGAGGGGGHFGGGGGGGGGAGSSYVVPGADQVSVTRSSSYTNGEVDISWQLLSKCADQSVQDPSSKQSVTVQLQCSFTDADGFYRVLNLPQHGTLVNRDFTQGTLDYVPQTGYSGTDSMTFDYAAPGLVSEPATVTFHVLAAPQPYMTLSATSAQVVEAEAPVLSVRLPGDATGDVGFYNLSLPGTDEGIGVAKIVDGVATLDTPTRPLLLGDNSIRASYGGDDKYDGVNSNTLTVTVVPKPRPSMTLSASAAEVADGQAPVLNVDMPADATGEVGFYNSALPGQDKGIGVAKIVDGVATLDTPTRALLPGANAISASYGGDEVYAANDSNKVTVTVEAS